MAAGSELAAFETRFGNSKRFPDPAAGGVKLGQLESKLLSWFTVVPSIRAGACLTLAFLQFIVVVSSRFAQISCSHRRGGDDRAAGARSSLQGII
jgi:hypothetical protein